MQKLPSKKINNEKIASKKINTHVYSLVFFPLFFIAYFFYCWLIINPVLYYQRQVPLFYFDNNFFMGYLTYPGGITDYISTFLAQLFYYPWLGALVITLIAWLISVNVKKILEDVSESKQVMFLNLVPAILLLMLHGMYEHTISIDVGLLIVLSAYNIFYKTAPGSIINRLVYYLFISVLVYYIAAGLYFLFVIMCLLQEVFVKKRNDLGFFYLILACFIPYIGANYVFILDLQKAYTYALKPNSKYTPVYNPYYLYLYFPIAFLVVFIFNRIASLKMKKSLSNLIIFRGVTRYALIAIILLAGGWFILDKTLDKYNRKFLEIENFAYNGEWQKIIEQVDLEMLNNKIIAFQLNRALYHTGRLASDMFLYPQLVGVDALILPHDISNMYPLDKCDILFELGNVSEAQHWVFESFAVTGYSPWNLQRLALISLVKGNDQVVIKCLNKLDKTLQFRKWASHYREYLSDKSLLDKDPILKKIRLSTAKSDFVIQPDNPSFDLEALLNSNKNNKMAFEYLMAYYLLERKSNSLLKYMQYLPVYGYKEIPRIYEEAILTYLSDEAIPTYLSLSGKDGNSLAGFNISSKSKSDFADLSNIIISYRYDKTAAYNAVMSKYNGTYWAYLLYN